MPEYDDTLARTHVEEIDAKVLSNRRPPYPIAGGLFDALIDSEGDVMKVTNEEAREANKEFFLSEGIDIHPAEAVATASLIKAVDSGTMDPEAVIMLNITGGGEIRFKENKKFFYLKPNLVFPINPSESEVVRELAKLRW